MLISLFYVTRQDVGSTANIQMLRSGYDVITVLEYTDVLQTLDSDLIETELFNLLPVSYHMRLEVRNGANPIIIETTTELPQDRFIGSGKRFFVTKQNEAVMVRFWIWVR